MYPQIDKMNAFASNKEQHSRNRAGNNMQATRMMAFTWTYPCDNADDPTAKMITKNPQIVDSAVACAHPQSPFSTHPRRNTQFQYYKRGY